MQMQFGRGMFICSFNFQRKIYFNANIWDSIYEIIKSLKVFVKLMEKMHSKYLRQSYQENIPILLNVQQKLKQGYLCLQGGYLFFKCSLITRFITGA